MGYMAEFSRKQKAPDCHARLRPARLGIAVMKDKTAPFEKFADGHVFDIEINTDPSGALIDTGLKAYDKGRMSFGSDDIVPAPFGRCPADRVPPAIAAAAAKTRAASSEYPSR